MTVTIPSTVAEVFRALARTTIQFLDNVSKSKLEMFGCPKTVMGYPDVRFSASDVCSSSDAERLHLNKPPLDH
jgi:hypothetical protein